MSTDVRIIKLRDFLHLVPQGKHEFGSLNQAISEAAFIKGSFSDYDLLIDMRGAETHLSAFDIWELAKNLAQTIHSGTSKSFTAKIPVLCPLEQFDHAEFFSLCSTNRGLNVRAFTSFEDMFEWLSTSSMPSTGNSV